MVFREPNSFVWALCPDVGLSPLQNKWRTAVASLCAGARGLASTHNTPYQVCTKQNYQNKCAADWMHSSVQVCRWICCCLLSAFLMFVYHPPILLCLHYSYCLQLPHSYALWSFCPAYYCISTLQSQLIMFVTSYSIICETTREWKTYQAGILNAAWSQTALSRSEHDRLLKLWMRNLSVH